MGGLVRGGGVVMDGILVRFADEVAITVGFGADDTEATIGTVVGAGDALIFTTHPYSTTCPQLS